MFFRKKGEREVQDIFVTLSNRFISIAYDNGSKFKLAGRGFNIQSDIETLIKNWDENLRKLLKDVNFKPNLYILIHSPLFMVKNIPSNMVSQDDKYEYISQQIDLPRGEFEMTQIQKNSHLVVENRGIEKILFGFKSHTIEGIYDISMLNSQYFLKGENEIYLNVSLSGVSAIYRNHIFQKRTLSYLFLNYLKGSAGRLNLDLDSTYEYIKRSFSDIDSYDKLLKSTQNGVADLITFIDDLVEFLHSTLKFFKNYDSIEHIDTIYLDGDILDLPPIIDILRSRLKLKHTILTNLSLQLGEHWGVAGVVAYRMDRELLKTSTVSLEGLRYSDGKQEYIFIDNTLVIQNRLTKEQRRRVVNLKRVIEVRRRIESSREHNSDSPSLENKSILQMDMGELFLLLKRKLRGESIPSYEISGDMGEERGKVIFLIVLLFGMGVYYLWSYIEELERGFQNRVNIYRERVVGVNRAREELDSMRGPIQLDSGVNKILWTEKFISIAKAMPEEIWLTSMRLESFKQKVNGGEIGSSRIILDGRSLPSSVGHINAIANYMDNLMSLDGSFKRDFIDVTFGGAESIYDNSNKNLISFQLQCNFRKGADVQDGRR